MLVYKRSVEIWSMDFFAIIGWVNVYVCSVHMNGAPLWRSEDKLAGVGSLPLGRSWELNSNHHTFSKCLYSLALGHGLF